MKYYAVIWSNGSERVFYDMGLNKQEFIDWCWRYGHNHYGYRVQPVKIMDIE